MGLDSLSWFYVPSDLNPSSTIPLEGEEWHHCHHVMRLATGDSLILFNGQGKCVSGRIDQVNRNHGIIDIDEDVSLNFEIPRPYRIHIGMALTKNFDRIEFAVEKLTELGVDGIYILDCEHSERAHMRMDRIQKCVISAAKQSRKIHLPAIHPLQSPLSLTKHFVSAHPSTSIFACHLDDGSKSLVDTYQKGQDVLLLIGPEGGFSNEETEQLKNVGATMVTLGSYRLRVETAAIRSCTTIHVLNEITSTL